MSSSVQTPPWFTTDFVHSIIRNHESDPTITITQPGILEPGTKAGDSFSGALHRTKVHYRSDRHPNQELSTSWMLKSESSDALNTAPALFNTEHRMYTEVLPAMQRELAGIGERLSVPGLIYGSESPRLIVMEDLSYAGWTRMDEICRFEDALPTIRMISMFHAASFALNKKGMTLSNFANRTSDSLLSMFRPMFSSYIDTICSWDDFKEIRPRLQEFKASFADQYKQVYTANPGPEGYNVLNHGDFHGKNLLHLLDDQRRVVKTAALDYQVCSWGSPAIDLIYFLYLVVHRDVLDNHRDQLLEGYHRHFVDCLTRLNFQGWVPTHEDLQAELNRNVFFELFNDAVGAPFRTVDFGAVSLEDFLAGRVPNVGLSNAGYRRNVRANLTRLVARVAFNVAK
ncbi:uncharacterized protein LOC6048697 [Culex quinquefasciatus]|uniref:uncharacterized protein LOC6048697 n=1 Tax=Culex quinquefasciatus TaxID=7176 RepID=UPI0018E31920|nr:uncharacterized protein LOC6048697 [Culex quinquefasciatus]